MERKEVQRLCAGFNPLRIGHGIGDRDAHVRHAELGNDCAVPEFNGRMNDGLGMHNHLDLFMRHIKQPVGFNDFKRFIEHAGRVNGDLGAHAPVGMVEGFCDRGLLDFFTRPGAERTA